VDWPTERYVRVYTRDSTTWKLLSWQARCTLMMLLRKVDRAGVLDHGGHGVAGLAAVIELPLEIVEIGIKQLVDPRIGSVVETEQEYVLPNFIEAQEAVQDEKTRSREYRARKRDRALARTKGLIPEAPEPVTQRDEVVTKRDATVTLGTSRDVTERHSGPILSVLPEISPPARTRDPVLVVPDSNARWAYELAEACWSELNELRTRLGVEFKLQHVRALGLHDTSRTDLQQRLRSAGNAEQARADFQHVMRTLEREARRSRSVSRISGRMFTEKAWEWALAQDENGLAEPRAGPRSNGRADEPPPRKIKTL
jgi:hypothetical protein